MNNQWLLIKTAPKDDTPIDIWSPTHGRLTNYMREQHSPTNISYSPVVDGICCVRDVTHWMPIPASPN